MGLAVFELPTPRGNRDKAENRIRMKGNLCILFISVLLKKRLLKLKWIISGLFSVVIHFIT